MEFYPCAYKVFVKMSLNICYIKSRHDAMEFCPCAVPSATDIPKTLILQLGSLIYFANSGYLRERILIWVRDEKANKASDGDDVEYVLLDFGGMSSATTSTQEQTGDGVESGNISRHQKRVQAAAAAASIYQSFVYPSPSTLTWYVDFKLMTMNTVATCKDAFQNL
ncbi:hypothetical protein L1887_14127 [Cichorium endivia]|nr:hypothetical protein L1887_14127 [Cichorium endivia]